MSAPKITYRCWIEPEETEIEGNASAIDPATDAENEAWIRRQLQSGNQAAWCCAMVEATCEVDGQIFRGGTSLGCCSWESERKLWADEGAQLRDAAKDSLLDSVRAAVKRAGVAVKVLAQLEAEG